MALVATGILGALMACGGGSSPSSTPTPNANIAGIWNGTIHSNSTHLDYPAFALVLPDGTFRYAASNWAQVVGAASTNGPAVYGTGTLFLPPSSTSAITLTATDSNNTLGGTFSGGDSGTLAFAPDAAANVPVQLSQLAGSYQATGSLASTGLATSATLDASGNFSGSDSQGTFTGHLTQVATNLNAFQVSVSYTLTGSTTVAYSGLAYGRPPVGTTHGQIYLQTTSTTGVFAGVFTAL